MVLLSEKKSTSNKELFMMKYTTVMAIRILLLICVYSFINRSFCQTEIMGVQKGVHRMADAVVRDLRHEGPVAWLRYFSHSQAFFMASDGQLVFRNNDSASVFVHEYAKQILRVDLIWNDIRIDSLTPHLALLATSYHETLTSAAGVQDTPSGYFTGLVEYTSTGWKFRNAHWSSNGSKH
jgi:hypothetical protein